MPNSESTFQFRTHWNYVRAFAYLAVPDLYIPADRLKEEMYQRIDHSLGNSPRRNGNQAVDRQVARSLRASLDTETLLLKQLELCEELPELSRSVLTWAAIQTYYACYHATQSLVVATGQRRPNRHLITQNQFASLWLQTRIPVLPWSLGFKNGNAINYQRPETSVSNIAMFNEDFAINFVDMSLRTTWEPMLRKAMKDASLQRHRERVRDWKESQKNSGGEGLMRPPWKNAKTMRLTPAQRSEVSVNLEPSTLLHYLYRLRVSANYVESDTFLDGPEMDQEALNFIRAITILAISTIRVHERRIAHKIGLLEFDKLIKRH